MRGRDACPACGALKALAAKQCRACWYKNRLRTYKKRQLSVAQLECLQVLMAKIPSLMKRRVRKAQKQLFWGAVSHA